MTLRAPTMGRVSGRLRLAVAGAVVLTALATATATAAAAPPTPMGGQADAGPRTPTPGFLLDRGRYRPFDAPQARSSTLPYGINNHGAIVGRYDDGSEQPFLRDRRGRFITLRIPGARSAWASGINDRGQIVGIYSENTPTVKQPGGRRHGYLWEAGRVTRIDVPGATETGAFGINNQGEVVGAYLDAAGRSHGFRWKRGRLVTIDVPGVADTTPQGINDRGQVVGYASDAAGTTFRGFVLSRGEFRTFSAPGTPFTLPVGINDRGQISGFSSDAAGTTVRGFLLAKGVNGCIVERRTAASPRLPSPVPQRPSPSASTTAATSWASTWTPTRSATASCSTTAPTRRSITRSPPPTARPTTSTTEAKSSACTSAPPARRPRPPRVPVQTGAARPPPTAWGLPLHPSRRGGRHRERGAPSERAAGAAGALRGCPPARCGPARASASGAPGTGSSVRDFVRRDHGGSSTSAAHRPKGLGVPAQTRLLERIPSPLTVASDLGKRRSAQRLGVPAGQG
jgi:probable HAF family extracellular repeat protein